MKSKLYEEYHKKFNIQKKIISNNNFTYRNLISIANSVLSKKNNSLRVLDIGCGVGTIDFYLASKGCNIIGIDISQNAIRTALASCKYLQLTEKIKFFCGNFPSKRIKGRYNIIIMSEILEHLKDDRKILKYVYKFLKKDGILILSTPSKNAPLFKLGLLSRFDRQVGHLRRYSIGELEILLKNNQMRIKKAFKTEGILRNFLFTQKYMGNFIRFLKGPFSDLFAFIDQISLYLFGESQIYIVASKK